MNKRQLEYAERLAKSLDKFNKTKMISDDNVNLFKTKEFGSLILKAEALGFKVKLSERVVMYLSLKSKIMIVVDCDDQYAYINTTGLWNFINGHKYSIAYS